MEIRAQFVPREGTDFPQRLVGVKPPIVGLWYRGDLTLPRQPKIVAIVGSRRMSRYGKQVLGEIVPKLVAEGYITISGFMYGIDIEMHRLTVENGGATIGVLGWGIDAPIISENQNLYHNVLESNGLFLSEYPPEMRATLWTFPQRNRIVVGLADLVIVIEAGIKSGSLNSADWAAKMGKPVYAVPGPIFSPVSAGCNWLLSQGLAKPFTLEFFNHQKYSNKGRIHSTKGKLTNDESTLVTLLRIEGPQSVNELSRRLSQPAGSVSAMLTTLLLRGVVSEDRGLWML